jgi:hypothetical protein
MSSATRMVSLWCQRISALKPANSAPRKKSTMPGPAAKWRQVVDCVAVIRRMPRISKCTRPGQQKRLDAGRRHRRSAACVRPLERLGQPTGRITCWNFR